VAAPTPAPARAAPAPPKASPAEEAADKEVDVATSRMSIDPFGFAVRKVPKATTAPAPSQPGAPGAPPAIEPIPEGAEEEEPIPEPEVEMEAEPLPEVEMEVGVAEVKLEEAVEAAPAVVLAAFLPDDGEDPGPPLSPATLERLSDHGLPEPIPIVVLPETAEPEVILAAPTATGEIGEDFIAPLPQETVTGGMIEPEVAELLPEVEVTTTTPAEIDVAEIVIETLPAFTEPAPAVEAGLPEPVQEIAVLPEVEVVVPMEEASVQEEAPFEASLFDILPPAAAPRLSLETVLTNEPSPIEVGLPEPIPMTILPEVGVVAPLLEGVADAPALAVEPHLMEPDQEPIVLPEVLERVAVEPHLIEPIQATAVLPEVEMMVPVEFMAYEPAPIPTPTAEAALPAEIEVADIAVETLPTPEPAPAVEPVQVTAVLPEVEVVAPVEEAPFEAPLFDILPPAAAPRLSLETVLTNEPSPIEIGLPEPIPMTILPEVGVVAPLLEGVADAPALAVEPDQVVLPEVLEKVAVEPHVIETIHMPTVMPEVEMMVPMEVIPPTPAVEAALPAENTSSSAVEEMVVPEPEAHVEIVPEAPPAVVVVEGEGVVVV
jgi:hypothetical protein